MRLLVATPLAVVVDADDVAHLRAEDETGAFGILPGHDDFLTVLTVSVLTWRDTAGAEHHVALRGGVMTLRDGNRIEVATREAVGEDRLQALGPAVLDRLRAEAGAEAQARLSTTRLHLAAIQELRHYLKGSRRGFPRPGGGEPPGEAPAALAGDGAP